MEKGHTAYDDFRMLCRSDLLLDLCIFRYSLMNLEIEFELAEYSTLDWLMECEKARRPYFEMCGPRISKYKADNLAKEYQGPDSNKDVVGMISTYGCEGLTKRNYSLFHLDGRVGLNGVLGLWDKKGLAANAHFNMLIFLLELIYTEHELEFGIMVTKWDEVPERFSSLSDQEMPITWEFAPQPKDVSYGVAYNPKENKIKILGPESAWKTVKSYQQLYTEEERKVFDPAESERYYETNPQGRQELAQFIKGELPNTIVPEIPLQTYIKNILDKGKVNDLIIYYNWPFDEWKDLYQDLDLKILFDVPQMSTKQWANMSNENERRIYPAEQKFFEICGPKISQQKAMEMAADYNEPTIRSTCGEMSHYDWKSGRGVFRLDGCVGLSGAPLQAQRHNEVMDALLDMIKNYPDFEFAILVTTLKQDFKRENGIAIYGKDDVEYGAWYDPSHKLLRILAPRAAYQIMKKFQSQYTQKERCLFEREASEYYYTQNEKGKKELEKFLKYQQDVCKKQI